MRVVTPVRHATCTVLVAALTVVSVADLATAQSYERGGWWGRRDSARSAMPLKDHDDQAARLYADARADIDHANIGMAQRKLEILVAKFPDSPLAEVARRDLQSLYAAPSPGASPPEQHRADPTYPPTNLPGPIAVKPVSTPIPDGDPVRRPTARDSAAAAPAASLVKQASEDFRTQAGDRIFFSEGSTELGTRARFALEAQAQWLARYPQVRVTVEGHADERGSRGFNHQISSVRADAVKARLIELGVAADRVTAIGLGRDHPVAECTEQLCASQNRRVVTVITRVPIETTRDNTLRAKDIATNADAVPAIGPPPRR